MSKRLFLAFAVSALVLFAGSVPKLRVYEITLSQPTALSGTLLPAGDYKLAVGDAKISVTSLRGGSPVESAVKIELSNKRFDTTVISYETNKNNKAVITEIDLGGSKTKLLIVQ